MYAVIGETSNYKGYTTPAVKFTVYADHKWKNMPQKLISKEQKKTIQCSYCGKRQNVILPKKIMSIATGRSAKLSSKNTGCTFKLKAKKKYISLSAQGKIAIKADPAYYRSMQTSVPVTVKAYGRTYTMTVRIKIPAPKVNIRAGRVKVGNVWGYRFKFYYNIPGADRIQVRMVKGETSAIRAYLNKYVSDPRPSAPPILNLSDSSLKKLKNKITLSITAHYGHNKSEVFTKTISVR